MSEKDIAVGITAAPMQMGALSKKPPHLITLEYGKQIKIFISLDKPDILNGFIQVKGMFIDDSEDEVIKNFSDILTNSSKELICDIMFPWHKIVSVRNLIFKAK